MTGYFIWLHMGYDILVFVLCQVRFHFTVGSLGRYIFFILGSPTCPYPTPVPERNIEQGTSQQSGVPHLYLSGGYTTYGVAAGEQTIVPLLSNVAQYTLYDAVFMGEMG